MDEETPLLHDQRRGQSPQQDSSKVQKTPLPWRQFSILLLLQVSEPITSQVISPFLPQLIKDIGVAEGDDSRIGYYVGLMYSSFFFTQACTAFHWSRTSDRIGRRPVLLTGLFGLSASMWCFGLSKTFWGIVLSRCLCGALNGNVGVMKSMTIEITDHTNVALAFSFSPLTWSLGATVGPLIGGSLAKPAERFPRIFGDSVFFKEYPYFLPCSVSATFTALSWLIAFLFLKETTKPQTAPVQRFLCGMFKNKKPKCGPRVNRVLHDTPATETGGRQLPFHAILVRPVLIAVWAFATLSLVDMAFRAMFPLFYATSIEMGGLDLDAPVIGTILAFHGIFNGFLNWFFFTPMHDWLGAKMLFLTSVFLYLPMIVLFPVMNTVARTYDPGYLVWFLVGLQLALFTFANFSFTVAFMFVGAAAPNRASIGATNGLAQMAVSVMRALGPMTVNSAFSLSTKGHTGGTFAYLVLLAMVGSTVWVGHLLPQNI